VKKRYVKIGGILAVTALAAGIVWAAFSDKGTVLGSQFSVGHSDLKLMETLAGTTDEFNLKDSMVGPRFENVTPNWQQDYLVKIYNAGTTQLQLSSNANYATVSDPDELRSYIYVEPFEWADVNGNGLVDDGEAGTSLGRKTITKWKTEGFNLGSINTGEIKGVLLRFSTDSLSDTKQGKTGTFDFEFDAIQL